MNLSIARASSQSDRPYYLSALRHLDSHIGSKLCCSSNIISLLDITYYSSLGCVFHTTFTRLIYSLTITFFEHLLLYAGVATTMYLSILTTLLAISAPVLGAWEYKEVVATMGCVCMVSRKSLGVRRFCEVTKLVVGKSS